MPGKRVIVLSFCPAPAGRGNRLEIWIPSGVHPADGRSMGTRPPHGWLFRMKIACTLFVLSIVLMNGVAGIRQALRLFGKRFRSCQGRIVTSVVRGADPADWRENDPEIRMFWPQVEFDYEVGGRTFRGDQFSFAKVGSSVIGEIETKLRQYPAGAVVEVFFNEADPAEAFLIHPGKHAYTSLLLVAVFLLVGGLLLFIIWRWVD